MIQDPAIDWAIKHGVSTRIATEVFMAGIRYGRQHPLRFGKVGEPGEPVSRTCLVCNSQFQDIIEQIQHVCKP